MWLGQEIDPDVPLYNMIQTFRFEGRIDVDGVDVMRLEGPALSAVRGKQASMIFQEPMTSLNPCFTVGFQLTETLKIHLGMNKAERKKRAIELLDLVGIPEPEKRLTAFPHQLSGGMNQRVMIAMAISCDPQLLVKGLIGLETGIKVRYANLSSSIYIFSLTFAI